MRPPLDALSLLPFLLSALCGTGTHTLVSAVDTTPAPLKPCTVHSPSTGSFVDLRPLQLTATPSKNQVASNVSYRARGYDYPYNFTINFCGPVVEKLDNVDHVARSRWANVSAYYHDEAGINYSLGQENHDLIFRGRKLLTNYTMGSPCPSLDDDGRPIVSSRTPRRRFTKKSMQKTDSNSSSSATNNDDYDDYDYYYDDDDDINTTTHNSSSSEIQAAKSAGRRKNTIISFVCDTSPTLSGRPAVSFIGTPDHCTYIFEVRSRYACGGTTSSGEKGTLGPGAVFLVILGIALLVYLIGGVVYRRNVMHQRGWKQIPNYEVWSAITSFVSDIAIIFFSSCSQSLPSIGRLFGGRKGGYHRVGADGTTSSSSSSSRRRGGVGASIGRSNGGLRDPDAENRLIDSYDEEWES